MKVASPCTGKNWTKKRTEGEAFIYREEPFKKIRSTLNLQRTKLMSKLRRGPSYGTRRGKGGDERLHRKKEILMLERSDQAPERVKKEKSKQSSNCRQKETRVFV